MTVICPKCYSDNNKILNERKSNKNIIRYRQCLCCNFVFITVIVEDSDEKK